MESHCLHLSRCGAAVTGRNSRERSRRLSRAWRPLTTSARLRLQHPFGLRTGDAFLVPKVDWICHRRSLQRPLSSMRVCRSVRTRGRLRHCGYGGQRGGRPSAWRSPCPRPSPREWWQGPFSLASHSGPAGNSWSAALLLTASGHRCILGQCHPPCIVLFISFPFVHFSHHLLCGAM